MKRFGVPFLMLLLITLVNACGSGDEPASTAPRATAAEEMGADATRENDQTRAAREGEATEVAGERGEMGIVTRERDVDLGSSGAHETSPPVATEPAVNDRTDDADVVLVGWVAGDYFDDGRAAGKWVRVEDIETNEVEYPSYPDYDCWGGCSVRVVAETCPVPAIGAVELVRVSGRNLDDGFGIDICVPGGGMVPSGGMAEGDPADYVHFLATYRENDLYNRESTILASVVDVLSGSPEYFSEVVRIREQPASSWAPGGAPHEEGMALEVFAWFEDPVAPGRPFAVFGGAFIIWDR